VIVVRGWLCGCVHGGWGCRACSAPSPSSSVSLLLPSRGSASESTSAIPSLARRKCPTFFAGGEATAVAAVAASPEARRRCFTSPGIFTRLRSTDLKLNSVGVKILRILSPRLVSFLTRGLCGRRGCGLGRCFAAQCCAKVQCRHCSSLLAQMRGSKVDDEPRAWTDDVQFSPCVC
jgi:hypothetical protein